MRTTQLKNLKETILGVQGGQKPVKAPVQNSLSEEATEYLAYLIGETERRLGINMTEEEIRESTTFILEQIGNSYIIEAVQNQVGFQLNESEIEYVLNTLNEQA